MSQSLSNDGHRLVKVSGIGQDRPGIVHKIANVISRHGGNILLQRSMQVAGDFAITVVASFEAVNQTGAQGVIRELGHGALGDKFVVLSRDIEITTFAAPSRAGTRYLVSIAGDDRMGIVEAMTLFLLQRNLNLDAMESEVTHVPFEGRATFNSTFEITVPTEFDIESFRAELGQIENDSDLVIHIRRLGD